MLTCICNIFYVHSEGIYICIYVNVLHIYTYSKFVKAAFGIDLYNTWQVQSQLNIQVYLDNRHVWIHKLIVEPHFRYFVVDTYIIYTNICIFCIYVNLSLVSFWFCNLIWKITWTTRVPFHLSVRATKSNKDNNTWWYSIVMNLSCTK